MSNNAAGGLMAARSVDGGATWLFSNGGDALIADGNDGLVAACCDPTIAWDTFGNLYISYISEDLESIPVAISTDGGATFSQLTAITGGNVDQPTVTTGPGLAGVGQSLWITYAQGGTQARGAAVSGLGAANVGAFGAAQAVTGVNQFGDIAIGPLGQVVVTGQNSTQIQVSTDLDGLGPGGFSAAVIATTTNVETFDAIPSQPSRTIDAEAGLAYDRSGGVRNGFLYLLYTDELIDENNNTEIFLRSSSDNGATWSARVRVNDDLTNRSQWFGKIALDQTTGDLGATWYDARNDPSNIKVQLFGSISSDGGSTWDTNTRISAGTIDGTVAATGGQQLGDYIGLTFDAGKLHPTWSDNSNSTLNNPDGILQQLDIYTATLTTAIATMTISPTSIREDAGTNAATITIKRVGTNTAADLVLDLFYDDHSEVDVPALAITNQVTILAGQSQITLPVSALDDTLLDGTQTVTFDLKFSGKSVTTATLQVTDFEPLNISISPTSITENAGLNAALVTVTRPVTDTTTSVIVTLKNSDPTEVSIPVQVTIPAGERSATAVLDAVDDFLLDGTQAVTITAAATGYVSAAATVDVLDYENIGIDIIADEISEADGAQATQARVFRTDTDGPFSYISQQTAANLTPKTILDFDKIRSQITVPSQISRLTDINITLSLKHTWLGDLDIFLISPSGTRVELVTDLISNERYMTETTFDDAALESILAGSAPFTGSYRPEGLLQDLNGENPSGIWTLELTDDNQQNYGTLFSWSLDFETAGLASQIVDLASVGAPGKIDFPSSVTIPANQAEVYLWIDAVDNDLLDGSQIATIQTSATTPGISFGEDSVLVLDQERLTFTVSPAKVSEAAGVAASTGTLTRWNTDISAALTVDVSSSDMSELIVPMTVTIPAGQSTVTFPIDAVDDTTVDGDQSVVITVSAAAYGVDKSQTIIVEDFEPSLLLTTATPVVAENSGSFQVTVTRIAESDLFFERVVILSVGAGLTVPSTVTIPVGQESVTFAVGIVDNAILDGTRTSVIDASGLGVVAGNLSITITDYETLTITVNKSSFLENAGVKAAIGTVSRSNTNLASALVVSLSSSDVTELKVPTTVTILAGQVSASFDIEAVNDPELDGAQLVTITAASTGYVNGTVSVTVEDHEPPVLTSPDATTQSS
ncbi:MAG: proprotein convertase P-domain-containing protein, partial [Planctomycetota bacterium]